MRGIAFWSVVFNNKTYYALIIQWLYDPNDRILK
jgi:hypothetical protein